MFLGTISGQRAAWKLSAIIQLSCFSSLVLCERKLHPHAATGGSREPSVKLLPEALNQLVAPIALYPAALIALILPASTFRPMWCLPRVILLKRRPGAGANQPWDDSVKSLVRYPDVVKWMDQNLEWTTQVGEAFLDQPADVMNTIQQLRPRQ